MIGETLRMWRLLRQLTLREAANQMGIGFATLSRIERGMDMDGRTQAKLFQWLFANPRPAKDNHNDH